MFSRDWSSDACSSDLKNRRIAVVDDEQESINTLIKLLAFCQGVDVVYESTSPIEALSFLSQHQVDLLITDVVMADIDGISLVGSLSNPPPIILMTSYSERAIDGFDIGALRSEERRGGKGGRSCG